MAHNKSCKKRIRQNEPKRERNRWYAKTMRNAVRDLRAMTDAGEAKEKLKSTFKLIDTVAKRNQIHQNKAANLKSKLTKFVATLG